MEPSQQAPCGAGPPGSTSTPGLQVDVLYLLLRRAGSVFPKLSSR